MTLKYTAVVLAAVQALILVWFEYTVREALTIENGFSVDRLSFVMILLAVAIGLIISLYALQYMKDFRFLVPMVLAVCAMAGIAASNNLLWMYFFWQLATVSAFFLIRYEERPEAARNALKALCMNLLGGLGFVLAIVFFGTYHYNIELGGLPVCLLVFAGMTKAAQMPFNSWLPGLKEAPQPVAALLCSMAEVTAGAFLILKLAPALGFHLPGVMVMITGGVTFLITSLLAASQEKAAGMLVYSTSATMGLVIAFCGLGTYSAVWAAIMILIIHTVTKPFLFLCAEASEEKPVFAVFMMVGIAGAFLAPLGILITKWPALVAFIDSKNILLIMCICFGSAATVFYWTKWLGKTAVYAAAAEKIETGDGLTGVSSTDVSLNKLLALSVFGLITVGGCLLFPLVSKAAAVPYLEGIFISEYLFAIPEGSTNIIWVTIAIIVSLPVIFCVKTKTKTIPANMSVDNKPVLIFNELKMNIIGGVVNSVVIVSIFSIMLAVAWEAK